MKAILFSTIVTIVLILLFDCVSAQVKTKIYYEGIPKEKLVNALKNEKEVSITPPEDFKKLLAGERVGDNNGEYKNTFAIPVKLNVNVLEQSNKIRDNRFVTYYLSLTVYQALNLSLQFNDFLLSDNSILSIFTSHELTDSITAKENNPGNIWATRVYQGEKIYIMLKVPLNEVGKTRLTIEQVGLGYKKVGGAFFGNPGASATCNINVACAAGNGWENERNSVALIVSNQQTTCTGTLTMNTCGTNTPYVLTANHCLDGNVANWVFQYQYWSTNCTTNSGWIEDIQFNGCTLRANDAATDFALVEMAQTPPANSGLLMQVGTGQQPLLPQGQVFIIHEEI